MKVKASIAKRCDNCKVGMVGCFAFKDKKAYDGAAKARVIVVQALKAAEKCEGCAIAMVTDAKCDACKIAYKDGKKVGPEAGKSGSPKKETP